MRLAGLFAWLSIFCLLPAVAAADRVPSPPSDCVRGAIGRTSHSGQFCGPSVCETDANCAQQDRFGRHDYVCRDGIALCVRDEQYVPGGHTSDPTPQTRSVADGVCIDGACPRGGSCQTARRCVERGAGETETEPESETASESEAATETESEAAESESEAAESESGSGGCSVRPGRSGTLPFFAMLGLLMWRRR